MADLPPDYRDRLSVIHAAGAALRASIAARPVPETRTEYAGQPTPPVPAGPRASAPQPSDDAGCDDAGALPWHRLRPAAPARKPPGPEARILRAITDALTADGHRVIRRSVAQVERGGRRFTAGTPGEPDLEVLLSRAAAGPGRVCWLEVKSADGTASDRQERYHARLRDAGYAVAVVRSVAEARLAVELAVRAYTVDVPRAAR